ncbi:MAG: M3 family oligoendopeptidase [Anaerolineales bacterium]|nr:MAG: M3 family oligoendopeptidase [Anaerolineales bacterium]
MNNQPPPRWDLSNIYPALSSIEFSADYDRLKTQVQALDVFITNKIAFANEQTTPTELSRLVQEMLERLNAVYLLVGKLRSYIHSFISTDSFNKEAKRIYSEYEMVVVRLRIHEVTLNRWVGSLSPKLSTIIEQNPICQAHAFYLLETAEQSQYQMSEAEETLAAELNLSGASAWNKLQGTVTSQLSVEFELEGEIKTLSMPALINLRSHPDEQVRKRAYFSEIETWENNREPLASALNGIKGAVNTLNRHRRRDNALHSALDSARIDRNTLQALLDAMAGSFPDFRRYFKAKASCLGKEQLAWWDIFAPLGKLTSSYSFPEACDFILEHFGDFSQDLKAYAQRAFENNWIDAEQRVGKRGGAFCMAIPGVNESRLLCNFDGSLDQVFTLAHELGHAYHNECCFRAGKTELQRITPMTLAETASIFCETIMTEAVLEQSTNPDEELAILETALTSDAQVIVDIYSRYLFEKEVFERREEAELSADEFCEIMGRSQQATYGDGLDEKYMHKYMWTWKPHYYYPGLSFYNFPYTFGMLFGIGLFAIYQERGESFIPTYVDLLANTGEATPADLAARFNIDIRKQDFWEASLGLIKKRIDRYCSLAATLT